MNIQQQIKSEVVNTETVMVFNEHLDHPTPQDISNVFAVADLFSHLLLGYEDRKSVVPK